MGPQKSQKSDQNHFLRGSRNGSKNRPTFREPESEILQLFTKLEQGQTFQKWTPFGELFGDQFCTKIIILMDEMTFEDVMYSMMLSTQILCYINRLSLFLHPVVFRSIPRIVFDKFKQKMILAGGPPPLDGRPQHLIEAAKRGRLDQMLFCFSAVDDTGAANDCPGRTPVRTSPQTLTKHHFTSI